MLAVAMVNWGSLSRIPACRMKFDPFALRQRSSFGEIPCTIDGVLNTSASVKSHWLASSEAIARGDFSVRVRDSRGEKFLESCGGDGTAGGIGAMAAEGVCSRGRRAFGAEGASEWKSMRCGRYPSTVVIRSKVRMGNERGM